MRLKMEDDIVPMPVRKNGAKSIKIPVFFSLRRLAIVVVAIVIVVCGFGYYVVGTPQYSLYKLRGAIIDGNDAEFEKYLDIRAIAEKNDEIPEKIQSELISSMTESFLELKELNPDKGKDASIYISTGLTGKYLKKASLEYAHDGSAPQVGLAFDTDGSELFARITKRNIDNPVAIYLGGQLVNSPIVQSEVTSGRMAITGFNEEWVKLMVIRINEQKQGMIGGLRIKEIKPEDEFSPGFIHVLIGYDVGGEGGASVDLSMMRMPERYWRITNLELVNEVSQMGLPAPEGDKVVTFNWKYKGKSYSLNESLYDSYYKFYNSLPAESVFNGESLVESLENRNSLFISKTDGDNTISELAQSIKSLGEKNKLNENQIVELVSVFVQTIPYDYEEFNDKDIRDIKIDYPYEVLWKNTGICSDKSYLAYSLLRELGYGVSFFLFQEDRHIAIGVKCPVEYSNYDSGYCFIETTSLGNKIGSAPSIMEKTRIASSSIELGDFGVDTTEDQSKPLGKIEILNKTDGLTYTGVIDTFNTQKEIDRLNIVILSMRRQLTAQAADLSNRREEVDRLLKKANRAAKGDDYDDYRDASSQYNKIRKPFNNDVDDFNHKNDQLNSMIAKYNSLIKSFYQ